MTCHNIHCTQNMIQGIVFMLTGRAHHEVDVRCDEGNEVRFEEENEKKHEQSCGRVDK